jgi:hypothetical protein
MAMGQPMLARRQSIIFTTSRIYGPGRVGVFSGFMLNWLLTTSATMVLRVRSLSPSCSPLPTSATQISETDTKGEQPTSGKCPCALDSVVAFLQSRQRASRY